MRQNPPVESHPFPPSSAAPDRALAAEFDEHLVKPVMIERLLEVLAGLMPPR